MNLSSYASSFHISFSGKKVISIFYKGLYSIFLVKLLLLWELIDDLLYTRLQWFDHQILTYINDSDLFGIRALIFLKLLIGAIIISSIVVKRNFCISVLIFMAYLLFYIIIHPVINGGDIILLFYLGLGIFFHQPKLVKTKKWDLGYDDWFYFLLLVAQIQLAFIYFRSGWDKLTSVDWRNGNALFNLTQIDYYALPWLKRILLSLGDHSYGSISWLIISFELLFSILIWPMKSRKYIIVLGVGFHVVIGFGLSLPVFSLIMIWSYVLFSMRSRYIHNTIANLKSMWG